MRLFKTKRFRITDGTTNGDVFRMVFPVVEVVTDGDNTYIYMPSDSIYADIIKVKSEWFYAPYDGTIL